MRKLSKKFMCDLKNSDGLLYPLLKRIKHDHTLMLAIRNKYINIYYRGGNILKIETRRVGYETSFNEGYNKLGNSIPEFPSLIKDQNDTIDCLNAFQYLKGIMDSWFSIKPKLEREFQQLIVRENNLSTISNESDYFVSDIEFALSRNDTRLDILALKWLHGDRETTDICYPALIEMKYGDDALEGDGGIINHLEKIEKLIASKDKYQTLIESMASQFNQLNELGLMRFKNFVNWPSIRIAKHEKPEVIIILANHNPRCRILGEILSSQRIEDFAYSSDYELRFFVSSFSGYALHATGMVSLDEFRKLESENYQKSKPRHY